MRRPLIGLSTSVTTDATPERAYVKAAYLRAVQEAGGIPVLLPPQLDAGARDTLVGRLDGIVLSGGGDVDPARYGEPAHPRTAEVSAARDALEISRSEELGGVGALDPATADALRRRIAGLPILVHDLERSADALPESDI